jgi:ribonucleoside-diphosphate reductase beta chain
MALASFPSEMSPPATLPSPQQMYVDWEHAHWSAHDIDLSQDVRDWASVAEPERTLLLLALASLMVAEERILTQFCGLVLAQDDEEEGSFLSSQLIDEVRHMQFYARFQSEVIADPGTIASHVARAREFLEAPLA